MSWKCHLRTHGVEVISGHFLLSLVPFAHVRRMRARNVHRSRKTTCLNLADVLEEIANVFRDVHDNILTYLKWNRPATDVYLEL